MCVQFKLHFLCIATFMLNVLLGMVSFILGCCEVNNSKGIAKLHLFEDSKQIHVI